jgi:hypothetical protein
VGKSNTVDKAIQQLHLCSAFKGYHADFMNCIETSEETHLYIVDNDENHRSEFIAQEDPDEKHFHAINKENKKIFLLSIDNALIKNHKGGIADCALFDTDLFCFIEFKSNAKCPEIEIVKGNYEKAISQLQSTLDLFKTEIKKAHADLLATVEKVVCHIVVSAKFPRASSMEQNYSIQFAEKNHLELCFDSYQEF